MIHCCIYFYIRKKKKYFVKYYRLLSSLEHRMMSENDELKMLRLFLGHFSLFQVHILIKLQFSHNFFSLLIPVDESLRFCAYTSFPDAQHKHYFRFFACLL